MFFEIIKIIFVVIFEFSKFVIGLIIDLIPTISLFKDIANAFSLPYILCGIFGIPVITLTIIKLIKRVNYGKWKFAKR